MNYSWEKTHCVNQSVYRTMVIAYLKKYRKMMLTGIFFFSFGCGLTLSLLKMDCDDGKISRNIENSFVKIHSKVEYAVLILSGADNTVQRNAIRATWMKLANNIVVKSGERSYKWRDNWTKTFTPPRFIKYYFAIGIKGMEKEKIIKLSTELTTNQDLLLLDDVEEGYQLLTVKMLKSIKWINENLKNLKYLIKCDDDSFVRIDLIIRDLETYGPTMRSSEIADFVTFKDVSVSVSPLGLYWGYFNGKARVYLSGKWKEEKWFLCDNYLPYAQGGGYVISKRIIDYIGLNNDLLSVYNAEDVSMGVWTAALSEISRVHDTRFDTEWKTRGCSHDMLVRHKQSPEEMLLMYKNLKLSKGSHLCSNTTEIWKSYRYNWDVLPSKCCK